MMTPNEAFSIAISAKPNVAFTGDCVDYRGCWVFPYSEKNDSLAKRVFVDKNGRGVMFNDPAFDVELWNSCRNYKDDLDAELLRKGKVLKHGAIRVKFADDSYLMHHGIKGMKWGVRNAETLAKYGRNGEGGGGSGAVTDDEEEKEEQVDWYKEMTSIASDPDNKTTYDKTNALAEKALSEVQKTQQYKDAEKTVSDLMSNADKAKDLYEKGSRLSDEERSELRAKAKEEKQEETRKRREAAKEAGNPLWMFA